MLQPDCKMLLTSILCSKQADLGRFGGILEIFEDFALNGLRAKLICEQLSGSGSMLSPNLTWGKHEIKFAAPKGGRGLGGRAGVSIA